MIINEVFTKRQTMITYRLEELLQMYTEGRLVLREINIVQVRQIRKYLFDNIEAGQVYFPPIVAYIPNGSLDDGKPKELHIIDGTQRLKALSQLENEMMKLIGSDSEEQQKKGFAMDYLLPEVKLAIQVFEGLTSDEADQMFIDHNTKGKKVALSKRIAYDSRNSINVMTNEILQVNELLKVAGVEQEKHAVMRPKNKNLVSLSQLRGLVGLFSLGRPIKSQAMLEEINEEQMTNSVALMDIWFKKLFKLCPAETIGDYRISKLASFPLLTAVAMYVLGETEDLTFEEKKRIVADRMQRLETVDWRRENVEWRQFKGSERGRDRYYYLHDDKQNMDALVNWLRIKGGE